MAFRAELDEEFGFDEGLFSGSGKKSGVTTHYLTSTSDFDGSDARPSINNLGDKAFRETVNFESGTFVGREGEFQTIAAPEPDVFVEEPVLNDAGTVAFVRVVTEERAQVFELVMIDNGGALTVVADTRGEVESFGFRPDVDQQQRRGGRPRETVRKG